MDITVLLEPKVDMERVTRVLDELGHPGRVHTVRTWGRHQLARIWEAAAGHRPITLEQFVPASIGPMVEVIHELKNSLPLFTHSQKRFCRPEDPEPKEVWGYNHASTISFTGPGYFVARPSDVEGEVVFDYTKLPSGKPQSWPALVPNETRLGRFVFANMVDHVRGVSNHVSIGRAMRGGTFMDTWFALCRKDAD